MKAIMRISPWHRCQARGPLHKSSGRIEDFREKASLGILWFLAVKDFKAGSDPKTIEEARQVVCRDNHVVRGIYDQIRDNSLPETEWIKHSWW